MFWFWMFFQQASSPTDFGNSWQTGDMTCPPAPGPVDPCDTSSATYTSAEAICNILIDTEGIYSINKADIILRYFLF